MKQHFTKLGWVISAVAAAVMISTGFQAKSDKVGVVDIGKVLNDTEYAKKQIEDIKGMIQRRKDLLVFMNTYGVFTATQASRFKELGTKAVLTGPEKTEYEKLKADVIAADKNYKALTQKPTPTAAETAKIQEYGKLQQETAQLLGQWQDEFQQELGAFEGKQQNENLTKAREVISAMGKAQGYTIIFVKDAAAYGANDITADVIKAVDKK